MWVREMLAHITYYMLYIKYNIPKHNTCLYGKSTTCVCVCVCVWFGKRSERTLNCILPNCYISYYIYIYIYINKLAGVRDGQERGGGGDHRHLPRVLRAGPAGAMPTRMRIEYNMI